jgi:NAD(P)-dependent dehydrogenase (short-subunit alcohol dehydrogenase family)
VTFHLARSHHATQEADVLLENKNAIIYGAGGSIGGAAAKTFARERARVFLVGRTRTSLDAVAADVVAAGGAAEVAVLDALDEDAVEAHAQAVVAEAGSIDVSFNLINRGDVQGTPLLDMTTADLTRAVTNGLVTNFVTARAAARQMVKQGSGVILHLNSGSARAAQPGMGSTGPADAATETLMRYLAAEVGPHGVRVLGIWIAGVPETLTPEKLVAVNPNLRLDDAAIQGLIGHLDQARMTRRSPRLDQVVETVAFLASDRAGGITGTMVNVTAGLIPE